MFKVNNKDTRTTPIAYFTPCPSVSTVNFEKVNVGWVISLPVPNKRYSHLSEPFYGIVEKHASLKKKALMGNYAPFIKKCLKRKYKQEADYEISTGKSLLWKTSVCTKIKGICLCEKRNA